jgi:hypothetical protein
MLFPGTLSSVLCVLKRQSVASKEDRGELRAEGIDVSASELLQCNSSATPIDFSTTPASRMRVALRVLSISRSSRASRALSTNAFRGQYEWCAVCAQVPAVQRRSARSVRDRKRNDLTDFHSGFASISQVPDTIYALSTAAGRAAIAVIRVSGPACLDVRFGTVRRPMPANA